MIVRRCLCTAAQPRPWLYVGLGNPGDKYNGTRHNVGFEMIDAFVESVGISVDRIHFKALFGQGEGNKSTPSKKTIASLIQEAGPHVNSTPTKLFTGGLNGGCRLHLGKVQSNLPNALATVQSFILVFITRLDELQLSVVAVCVRQAVTRVILSTPRYSFRKCCFHMLNDWNSFNDRFSKRCGVSPELARRVHVHPPFFQ